MNIDKQVEAGSLLLRPAEPEDFNEIFGLIKEYKPNRDFDSEKQKRIFQQILNDHDVRIWVADAGENLVGMFTLHLHAHLHHDARVGFIEDFVVYKKYWGLKIRTRLLEKAKELAEKSNCKTIEVTTPVESDGDLRFFQENGFVKSSYKLVEMLKNG